MTGLSGQVALVTGAGGGIGSATCHAMIEAGATVVAVDRDHSSLTALVASCGSEALGPVPIVMDASEEDAWRQVVDDTLDRFGRIDILFNNAGIEGEIKPIHDYPVELFDQVLFVNLRSAFLGTKSVLPTMYGQGSGAIINCASISGTRGAPGMAGYVASKHALIGLTRVAAMEAAAHGVRVNAVCPGPIETRMMRSIITMDSNDATREAVQSTLSRNPSGRWGLPHEVASAVLFLASPSASYVNGTTLTIDGGRTAS